MLLAVKSAEIFPKHNEYGFISKIFDLKDTFNDIYNQF